MDLEIKLQTPLASRAPSLRCGSEHVQGDPGWRLGGSRFIVGALIQIEHAESTWQVMPSLMSIFLPSKSKMFLENRRMSYQWSKAVCVCACAVLSDSLQPSGHSPPGFSVHGIFQARILEWVAISSFRRSSNPGIEPASLVTPVLAGVLFTSLPPGKSVVQVKVSVTQLCPGLCDPMDYTAHRILQAKILEWVAVPFSRGSSQPRGSNPGLPHCRRILYQLSHQGRPPKGEYKYLPIMENSKSGKKSKGGKSSPIFFSRDFLSHRTFYSHEISHKEVQ